jgi:hypothetical protein
LFVGRQALGQVVTGRAGVDEYRLSVFHQRRGVLRDSFLLFLVLGEFLGECLIRSLNAGCPNRTRPYADDDPFLFQAGELAAYSHLGNVEISGELVQAGEARDLNVMEHITVR